MNGHYEKRFGGYEYGNALALPEDLASEELLKRPFWQEMSAFLAGSFVISSGRQYAQFCDQAAMAALLQESDAPIDWEVLSSPLAVKAVRSWELPSVHTAKPRHTEGLVPGVLNFWWQMQVDALHWRYDASFELPSKQTIAERFQKYSVNLYQTSSTTTEELAAVNEAVGDLRDDPSARTASCDELVIKALPWQLKASMHWLSYKRPLTNRSKGGDVHAVRWRDAMLEATAKPEDQRNLYDRLLMRHVQALDWLVAMTHDELADRPALAQTRWLYDAVVEQYNVTHVDAPITSLHRDDTVQEREVASAAPLAIAGMLGSVS